MQNHSFNSKSIHCKYLIEPQEYLWRLTLILAWKFEKYFVYSIEDLWMKYDCIESSQTARKKTRNKFEINEFMDIMNLASRQFQTFY